MNLHSTQEKLLKLLSDNIDSPLTMREIRSELNLSSPSLVHHHINQLEKKGYLKRNPNNPADYQILTTPEAPISFLNLYRLAKCGPDGLLLSGKPVDRIPLSSNLIPFSIEQAFLVKVDGDSMSPEIRHEDLVIAKKQQMAENREIIICSLDGMAMIKKFRKLLEGHIILESINSKYDPIFVKEDMTLRVEGVFKGLIRR